MSYKTHILPTLLAALLANDAAAASMDGGASDELLVQRERLASRLDAVKSTIAAQTNLVKGQRLSQWRDWSDFQNSWNNFGNW